MISLKHGLHVVKFEKLHTTISQFSLTDTINLPQSPTYLSMSQAHTRHKFIKQSWCVHKLVYVLLSSHEISKPNQEPSLRNVHKFSSDQHVTAAYNLVPHTCATQESKKLEVHLGLQVKILNECTRQMDSPRTASQLQIVLGCNKFTSPVLSTRCLSFDEPERV